MGLMENFGRVASTYMDEKDKLLVAGEKRQRERIGHAFWPHEVLRDALIFGEVKNMEHYREIIGGLKSLEHIEQELKSLLDKQEQVDD